MYPVFVALRRSAACRHRHSFTSPVLLAALPRTWARPLFAWEKSSRVFHSKRHRMEVIQSCTVFGNIRADLYASVSRFTACGPEFVNHRISTCRLKATTHGRERWPSRLPPLIARVSRCAE